MAAATAAAPCRPTSVSSRSWSRLCQPASPWRMMISCISAPRSQKPLLGNGTGQNKFYVRVLYRHHQAADDRVDRSTVVQNLVKPAHQWHVNADGFRFLPHQFLGVDALGHLAQLFHRFVQLLALAHRITNPVVPAFV